MPEAAENFDAVEPSGDTGSSGSDSGQSLDDWENEEGTPEPEPTPKGPARAAKPQAVAAKTADKPSYDPATKVKVVVDGEEVEITLDQAVREYRRRQAADKRFQEAASTRKEAEHLLAQLKADPWGALQALGIDPDKAASERILAKIEEERLATENPSELARRKLEKELADATSKNEAAKKATEDAAMTQQREAFRQKIDKDFTAALTTAKLPATPYTVARMADVMARNIREDPRFNATPAELAALVREDLTAELTNIARAIGPDQLEALLGPESIKALRKHDLEKLRNPRLQSQPRRVGDAEAPIRRRKVDYRDPIVAKKALDDWAAEG